jgi:hypothetical protein
MKGMSYTFGKTLESICFDVNIYDCWWSVPRAEFIVSQLGLEFVPYERIPATLECIDAERDKSSVQSKRNGIIDIKQREGVVLRPLEEYTKNNDVRVIVKHKGDDFRETKSKRIVTQEELEILKDAKEVAVEWVTDMRLSHIISKMKTVDITKTGNVIRSMIEDVKRESNSEVLWSKLVEKEIGKQCAIMFKNILNIKEKED